MTIVGYHLIVDIKNVPFDQANDFKKAKELLEEIEKKANLKVIEKMEKIFEPQGFSIMYFIEESHVSIHTYPEKGIITFDMYTCGNENQIRIAERLLEETYSGEFKKIFLLRGE